MPQIINVRHWVLLGLISIVSGCAGASVDTSMKAGNLPKPDMIVINEFAVTPQEVTLDKGMMASAVRDSADGSVTADESKLGHMVAKKLAEYLVTDLQAIGINAGRASDGLVAGPRSLVLHGEFVTINQGNQSERVWIGFGLGGSELRTQIQAYQNGVLVASGDTKTKSGMKPGMVASVATGGAGIAVGAATGGVSEAFLATVDADAKRTAKEVVKKIQEAYVKRGWL